MKINREIGSLTLNMEVVLELSCERQSLSETPTVGYIGKQEAFVINLMKKPVHLSEAGPN